MWKSWLQEPSHPSKPHTECRWGGDDRWYYKPRAACDFPKRGKAEGPGGTGRPPGWEEAEEGSAKAFTTLGSKEGKGRTNSHHRPGEGVLRENGGSVCQALERGKEERRGSEG